MQTRNLKFCCSKAMAHRNVDQGLNLNLQPGMLTTSAEQILNTNKSNNNWIHNHLIWTFPIFFLLAYIKLHIIFLQ